MRSDQLLKPFIEHIAGDTMNKFWISIALMLVLTGCHHRSSPTQLVYSSGFSFAQYDYVTVSKSDGKDSATALYGMDVG